MCPDEHVRDTTIMSSAALVVLLSAWYSPGFTCQALSLSQDIILGLDRGEIPCDDIPGSHTSADVIRTSHSVEPSSVWSSMGLRVVLLQHPVPCTPRRLE